MPASLYPFNPRYVARQLLTLLENGDVAALKRARDVYRDLVDVPDVDVHRHAGLQRCQHIIATEHGARDWSQLLAKIENDEPRQVVAILGHVDFDILWRLAKKEPADSLIVRMLTSITTGPTGYRALGTRAQCEELIAWSLRVHPRSARTPSPFGEVLRIEPVAVEDDDGPDELHYINDLDAPGEL